MGFATLNGIQFYGIPIRSSCLYESFRGIGLNPNTQIRHERYFLIGKEIPLSDRRKQLATMHLKLVPAMIRSHGYRKFSDAKREFIAMHMYDGLICAAGRWNPLHKVDGKRVKFCTYAHRVIETSSFDALAEWKRGVRLVSFKESAEFRLAGNANFVPDPESVKELHPYEGYDDLQWESLLELSQNSSCRSAKQQYEISLRYYGKGETLQAIGESLGITRERVRQIINKYKSRVLKAYRLKRPD